MIAVPHKFMISVNIVNYWALDDIQCFFVDSDWCLKMLFAVDGTL